MNLLTTLDPKFVLTGYESKSDDGIYMELYNVHNGKLQSGKPLTKDTLNAMIKLCKPQNEIMPGFTSVIPEKILYFNYSGPKQVLMWWTKERKAPMYFTKELKMTNGPAWQPAMLWISINQSLYVYFLEKNKKPNMKTILCDALFPNVSKGHLCNGTMPTDQIKEEKDIVKIAERWEQLFYNSEFSHKMHLKLWAHLIETKQRFPKDQFKPVATFQKIFNEHKA